MTGGFLSSEAWSKEPMKRSVRFHSHLVPNCTPNYVKAKAGARDGRMHDEPPGPVRLAGIRRKTVLHPGSPLVLPPRLCSLDPVFAASTGSRVAVDTRSLAPL